MAELCTTSTSAGNQLVQRLRIAYDDDEVLDQVRHDVVMTRRIS